MKAKGTAITGTITTWTLAGVLGVGGVSLLLAMGGVLSPWLACPIGLACSFWIARRIPPDEAMSPIPVAAIVLCLGSAVAALGIASPHEHVLGGRDSGTYVSTAAWVAHNGSIRIDAGVESFEGLAVDFESLGFRMFEDGKVIYPQFMHLFPVLMGLVGMSAGLPAMFWVGPVLGGLGVVVVYSLARRIIRPWWAAVAALCTATSLPYLYFSRAPFSEPLAFILGVGGMWLGVRAFEARSVRLALWAGVCLGGVFVARLDGLLVMVCLAVFIGALELLDRAEDLVLARKIWLAATATALIGVVDSFVFSPFYVADHGVLLGMALSVILLLRLGVPWLRKATSIRWASPRVTWMLAALMGSWLLIASLRPQGSSSTGAWLSWYFGVPLLLCALMGLLWGMRVFFTSGITAMGLPVSMLTVTAAIYLFQPSIATDHIWAMRRFLPLIIPLALLFAVWLIEQVIDWRPSSRWVVAPLAVVVFLLPGLRVTWPVGTGAEIEGGVTAIESTCDRLGTDAVVLVEGRTIADVMLPMVRGWCNVPVAMAPESDDGIGTWADAVASRGRQPVMLGLGFEKSFIAFEGDFQYLENAIGHPPRVWEPIPVRIVGERLGQTTR